MTRSELVRQAREGDRDAYDILLTEVVDHLYRIARLILRDIDRAEDAVQETLVRCWRDPPSLRNPDRFDSWLNRILMRAITDEARTRRALVLNVVPLRVEPFETDSSNTLADRDEIARVFEHLSVEHRTIVVLPVDRTMVQPYGCMYADRPAGLRSDVWRPGGPHATRHRPPGDRR